MLLERDYTPLAALNTLITGETAEGGGEKGEQGPHFNARPAADTRNGKAEGMQQHYPFKKTF